MSPVETRPEEPAGAGRDRAEPASGPGRVLGVFVVLALFLGGLAMLASGLFAKGIDAAAKQREYFGERSPPFALALDSAVRLSGGVQLVRFARADGTGAGPDEVLFLEPASRAAAQALLRPPPEELPGSVAKRIDEWQKDKSFELLATRKSGEISWGEWSAKLLIVRAFAKGGGWRDEARVDLSSGTRALVLLVHWPAEVQADEGVLRELLATVVLAPAGP